MIGHVAKTVAADLIVRSARIVVPGVVYFGAAFAVAGIWCWQGSKRLRSKLKKH